MGLIWPRPKQQKNCVRRYLVPPTCQKSTCPLFWSKRFQNRGSEFVATRGVRPIGAADKLKWNEKRKRETNRLVFVSPAFSKGSERKCDVKKEWRMTRTIRTNHSSITQTEALSHHVRFSYFWGKRFKDWRTTCLRRQQTNKNRGHLHRFWKRVRSNFHGDHSYFTNV